jgi:hypothetical protein
MAEVQKADTSIYANLNTQKPMSLADMLNISKSTYELSKLKELYPAMIAEQEAKSKSAQIAANVAEQTQNPAVAKQLAESTKSQLETNNAHFNNIIKNGSDLLTKPDLTKEDIIQRYTDIHKNGPNANNPVALKQALMGLPEKGSPTDYKKFIIANMGKTLDSQSQFEKMFPAVNLTDVGGKIVPVTTGNPYVAQIAPGTVVGPGIQKQGVAPQRINVNGVEGLLDANGKFTPLGESEQNAPVTAPPTNVSTAPSKEKPELITNETKVISTGGVPQLNDQQKQAYEAATKEKQSYLDLSRNNQETKKSIDSAYKTINSAVGNKPGQLARTTVKSIFGNTELEILNKSLADVYVRQAAMLGAKTDQGSADIKETQGNPNLTVGGLKSILERANATTTAWEGYTKANAAYEKNRGIYGANVNHEQFKKAWASNYDTNIFILQNIHDSNLPKAEKELEAQKLFKGMSDAQIKEFERKAKNIYALENGTYK